MTHPRSATVWQTDFSEFETTNGAIWRICAVIDYATKYCLAVTVTPTARGADALGCLSNYFYPQQKLLSKVRDGAKVTKKYDTATTPYHRAINHPDTTVDRRATLARTHALINPAATQRQIQALTARRHKMTTDKSHPTTRARVPKRARLHEATNPPSRAS